MESVNVQPYHWECRDVDGHIQILCWGLSTQEGSKESTPHLIRIEDFYTLLWVELPRYANGKVVNWDKTMATYYYNYIQNSLQVKGAAPMNFSFEHHLDIYNYQTKKKPYMLLIFSSIYAMRECEKFLSKRREFYIGQRRIGYLEPKVWETDISSIRKMLTSRNCNFSGWLHFEGVHPVSKKHEGGVRALYDECGQLYYEEIEEEYEQISTLPIEQEWIVSWENISMTPEDDPVMNLTTYPKVLAYDIEVYSDNVRRFPDMYTREHCMFMISCVYQRMNCPETRKYHALVFGDVNHVSKERWTTLKDAEIQKFDDELELVDALTKLVTEYDVEVLTGYNIYDFDNPYIDARLKLSLRKTWPRMGRLLNVDTVMHNSTWESSGYGFNSINDLVIPGRITIDMLPVIRRGYKLMRYNLETVSKHFLDRGKHDVKPAEMFLSFERNTTAIREWRNILNEIQSENAENFKRECEAYMDTINEELLLAENALLQGGEKWLLSRDRENANIRKAIYANLPQELSQRETAWKVEFEKEYTPIQLELIRKEYKGKEVREELLMHDNLNDPANSPMYSRTAELNWCSKETWSHFQSFVRDTVQARGLKTPQYAQRDVLIDFSISKYLMTRVMVYCLFDSDLCIELFEKLTVWIEMISMSAVMGVTPYDLFTHGQQIRCLSQLYDYASKKGYVLNKRPSPDIFFNGGFVFDVVPDIYDGVMVEDFASLYPSIMIAYNICYTTLLTKRDFGTLPSEKVFTIDVPRPDKKAKDGAEYDFLQKEEDSEEDILEDEEEEVAKERRNQIMSSLGDIVSDNDNYYFQFVKPEVKEGVIPGILRKLIAERAATRKIQSKYEKGTFEWKKYEVLQLAIKTSTNSMFGFLGAGKKGKRSLIEGAMSITAMGRKLICEVNGTVEEKYGCKMVYGDSVTPDMPILCRLNGEVFYRTIDDLPSNEEWEVYHDSKEQRKPVSGLEVWSDQGFTPIRVIIRHNTDKRIFRITTHAGIVKVTEDHSLLLPDGSEIRPSEVDIGTILMTADLPRMEFNEEFHYQTSYTVKGMLEASKLQAHLLSLGYEVFVFPILEEEIYIVSVLTPGAINKGYVCHIEDLGKSQDYVYDLETENHHFAAGVGKLVVHNTDSSMFSKLDIPRNEYNAFGKNLAKEMSKQFLEPLKLEFEKTMKMLALARKKYAGYVYQDDGSFLLDKETGLPYIYLRGNVLARRDNAKWLRSIYEKLVRMALDETPIHEVLLFIVQKVEEFMNGPIDHNDLVTVRSINAHYKKDTYFMKLFADRLAREGMPVKPGERIGYLVVKGRNEMESKYVGNRMILPEMYLASKHEKEPYEIDRLYYLERQFMNSIDQVVHAGFRRRLGDYEKIQYRRKGTKKQIGISTPIQLIIKLYEGKESLDNLKKSIQMVSKGRDPLLSEKYEKDGYKEVFQPMNIKEAIKKANGIQMKLKLETTKPSQFC